MNEKEKKMFWRKLLGYPIGKEITVTYEVPLKHKGKAVGMGQVVLSGKVIKVRKSEVILDTLEGCTIILEESKVLDVRPSTKENKQGLKLHWGESLEAYLSRVKWKEEGKS